MFQERIRIETPEHVEVEFEIAGPMTRMAAGIVDLLVLGGSVAVVFIGFAVLAGFSGGVGKTLDFTAAAGIATLVLMVWGYWPVFELLMDGQTPGKRLMGIRVVRQDFLPLDFRSVFLRNVVRFVDMQPGVLHAVGLATMILSRRALRFGDMVAGTWVVRESKESALRARATPGAGNAEDAPSAADGLDGLDVSEGRLTAAEYQVVERFMRRRTELPEEGRRRVAGDLATPIRARLGEAPPPPASQGRADEEFLAEEYRRGVARRLL